MKRGERREKEGDFTQKRCKSIETFTKCPHEKTGGKTNQSHASNTHAAYIVINRSKDQLLPPEPAYLLKGGISEH